MGTNTGRSDAPQAGRTFSIIVMTENRVYTSKRLRLTKSSMNGKKEFSFVVTIPQKSSK